MKNVSKNQETRAVTEEEYLGIIKVLREGRPGFFKPNERAAMALVMEANLGVRISDIVKLRPCDIIRDGGRWRLSIVEKKTGKERYFKVSDQLRAYIVDYCYQNGIREDEPIVQIKCRTVQDALKKVCNYLELDRIGTHSFRKYFALRIYENNDRDIELVRDVLQHESVETTQRYIRTASARVEAAVESNMILP